MDEEGSRVFWMSLIGIFVALGLISAVRTGIASSVRSGLRDAEPGSVARRLADAYDSNPRAPTVSPRTRCRVSSGSECFNHGAKRGAG